MNDFEVDGNEVGRRLSAAYADLFHQHVMLQIRVEDLTRAVEKAAETIQRMQSQEVDAQPLQVVSDVVADD